MVKTRARASSSAAMSKRSAATVGSNPTAANAVTAATRVAMTASRTAFSQVMAGTVTITAYTLPTTHVSTAAPVGSTRPPISRLATPRTRASPAETIARPAVRVARSHERAVTTATAPAPSSQPGGSPNRSRALGRWPRIPVTAEIARAAAPSPRTTNHRVSSSLRGPSCGGSATDGAGGVGGAAPGRASRRVTVGSDGGRGVPAFSRRRRTREGARSAARLPREDPRGLSEVGEGTTRKVTADGWSGTGWYDGPRGGRRGRG